MTNPRENLKHGKITDAILQVFYKRVYADLGYGFLEKVYENAMVYELRQSGLAAEQQQKIDVYYRGVLVGGYFADLVVNNKVIVELKAALKILPQHEAQLLNYLRATQFEVGLLLNFGPKPTHQRKILTTPERNWQDNSNNPCSSVLVRVLSPICPVARFVSSIQCLVAYFYQ